MALKNKMYDKSPRLGRGESGDMEITRKSRTDMEQDAGAAGAERGGGAEAIPHHVRHAQERNAMHGKHVHEKMQMHHRHEHEHAMHDHAGHGEKHEMHARHHAEHEAMHKQQEKEMQDMMSRHESEGGAEAQQGGQGPETGGGQISKIEQTE